MKKDDTNNGDRLLAYFKKAGKEKKAKNLPRHFFFSGGLLHRVNSRNGWRTCKKE